MNLRTKLLLAQLPLIVALVVIGGVAVATVFYLDDYFRAILHDNYRSVLAMQRIKEAVERLDSAALFRLAGHREEAETLIARFRGELDTELDVAERNITEPGEHEEVRHLRERWEEYACRLDAYRSIPARAEADPFYFTRLYPLFQEVKQLADRVLILNQEAMVAKNASVRLLANRMSLLMPLSTLLAVSLAVWLSFLLTRRLLRPLTILTQAARRLGTGDHTVRAHVAGRDEIARLAGAFNVMADHLERFRREALDEVRQAQNAARAVIDGLEDPVVVFDGHGKPILTNDAAVAAPDWLVLAGEARRKALAGGQVARELTEAIAHGDGQRWYLPRIARIVGAGWDASGAAGMAVLFQEVTRWRRFDELSNNLAATVAHEFRTPLTSLHMAIHLCLDETVGRLEPTQEELLFTAREDCQRLQVLVNDLLDLSRIRSGHVAMRPRPVPARELLESTALAVQVMAAERGVTLEWGHATLGSVLADPERIGVVLSNLLSNALHHTPSGGRIALSAYNDAQVVRFEVRDTGEGVPEQYRERIFDRFFRVPGRTRQGTGLGLSICREIVMAHGGNIGVESRPGNGSIFWFTLADGEGEYRDSKATEFMLPL